CVSTAVASKSTLWMSVAPRARKSSTSLSMPCVPRAASTTGRPGHNLRASSPPISLRPPRMRTAPLAELTRPLVQRFNAIFGRGHDIFNAHTPLARHVDTWLDGKGHTYRDNPVIASDDEGLFVATEPNAVA